MKIMLVMLSNDVSNHITKIRTLETNYYNLGLLYLYSVLEKEGHKIKVISLSGITIDNSEKIFFQNYENFNPDIVGFSFVTEHRIAPFKVIEKLTVLSNPPHIIIGGIHASVMYDQIINKYPQVIAVIGEGESTIIELVKALEGNTELNTVKGIAFYQDGHIITTEERPLIDLDKNPFPKHEVWFDSEPLATTINILTTRGCPSRCSFCCLKISSRGQVRQRDINNVVEELRYLKNKYPRIKSVYIQDDTFSINNKRVIQFCKLVIEAKLGLTFECQCRVKPVSREMFRWMEKAGFKKINFGIETGSERLLESCHKNVKNDEVMRLVKLLKPFHFEVLFLMICGLPGENDYTIRETARFIRKVQKENYITITQFTNLQVYPGTEVYEIMKQAGQIDDEYWLTDKPIPNYTVDHTLQDLNQYGDYLLDRTGIRRILTVNGFLHHFIRMPVSIAKYISTHKETIPAIISVFLYSYFPKLYTKSSKLYNNIYNKNIIKTMNYEGNNNDKNKKYIID